MSATPRVAFRRLTADDLPQLCTWFAEPAVARWWNMPATLDAVTEKYAPRIAGIEPTRMWIVEVDGVRAGLLQSYWHRDYPAHDASLGIADAVGIDYLIGGSHRGRGFASRVLGDFVAFVLLEYPEASVVVATPAQANAASWRALERAGFVRVGTCQPPGEPPAFAYASRRSDRADTDA